jgi:citrate synthase
MSSAKSAEERLQAATDWWQTAITDIRRGHIGLRGYPVQDLIGHIGYAEMVWLMVRGELPTRAQGALLEACLVAAVDHGPHAPSIAISRMAVTCGLPLNGAMASAINALDDVHGGAGQQCMALMQAIDHEARGEPASRDLVAAVVDHYAAMHGKVIPGFGHRWHGVDPRSTRLLELVKRAVAEGVVGGRYAAIGMAIEALLQARKGVPIPMNIDGITAAIFLELGFPPPLGRGLFILSRSVGILAHAWEQTQQGGRIKGPMSPEIPYRYTGPAERRLDPSSRSNES